MSNKQTVFQLKIVLVGSKPAVWRRILVPATDTFFDLHVAIQDAMGWTDSHLHAFYVGKGKVSDRITIEFPNPEGEDMYRGETRDERKERIADYFGASIKQCVYDYDFGDGWTHTVLLERELPAEAGAKYPQCVAGENACPPEDCGGLGGYDDLQEIVKNSKHPEHADMLEWLCLDSADEFDPTAFDSREVEFQNPRKRLKEYQRGFGI